MQSRHVPSACTQRKTAIAGRRKAVKGIGRKLHMMDHSGKSDEGRGRVRHGLSASSNRGVDYMRVVNTYFGCCVLSIIKKLKSEQ